MQWDNLDFGVGKYTYREYVNVITAIFFLDMKEK